MLFLLLIVFIVFLILIKLSFVMHRKKGRIKHPYIQGIAVSVFLGFIYIVIFDYMTKGADRYSSAFRFSAFVLSFFILTGLAIALLYDRKEEDKILEKRYYELAAEAKKVTKSEKRKQNNK